VQASYPEKKTGVYKVLGEKISRYENANKYLLIKRVKLPKGLLIPSQSSATLRRRASEKNSRRAEVESDYR